MRMREETFGPTLPLMKVQRYRPGDREGERSWLGLSGSVWTRDRNKAMALARKTNTGIGEHQRRHHGRLPIASTIAGWNESGLGSAAAGPPGSATAAPKAIVADRVAMKKEPLWYPDARTASSLEPWSG